MLHCRSACEIHPARWPSLVGPAMRSRGMSRSASAYLVFPRQCHLCGGMYASVRSTPRWGRLRTPPDVEQSSKRLAIRTVVTAVYDVTDEGIATGGAQHRLAAPPHQGARGTHPLLLLHRVRMEAALGQQLLQAPLAAASPTRQLAGIDLQGPGRSLGGDFARRSASTCAGGGAAAGGVAVGRPRTRGRCGGVGAGRARKSRSEAGGRARGTPRWQPIRHPSRPSWPTRDKWVGPYG